MNRSKRGLLAASLLILLTPGCAVDSKTGAQSIAGIKVSDDPCTKVGTAVGAVAGGVAGALITSQFSKSTEARLLGAAGGALIGGLIGYDVDKRRCELFRIAKKHNIDIIANPIAFNAGELPITSNALPANASTVPPGSHPKADAPTGLSVVIKDAGRQFATGSDQLTPNARAFFLDVAEQYSYARQSTKLPRNPSKEDMASVESLKHKRIFLIGHTDDVGNSKDNAALAERRAATVARLFRDQGIAETQLFFQGAGETLPMADNRTDEGRAANRRVELVELADDASFRHYLAMRKPNYDFYRPVDVASNPTPPQASTVPSVTAAASSARVSPGSPLPPAAKAATTGAAANATVNAASVSGAARPVAPPAASALRIQNGPVINYGGTPYNAQDATIKVSPAAPAKPGFSFITPAYADNSVVLTDCSRDRPRAVGQVKSLRGESPHRTNEHLPQLFGKTWASSVNGNLVVINKLAILRDGGAAANLPELKVYANYKPTAPGKPDISEEPSLNTYLVSQGVLVRMFPANETGLKCVDLLFGTDGATSARAGKLIYNAGSASYMADFKPQIQ